MEAMWELKLAAAGRPGEERFCLEISLSQRSLMDDYGHDLGDIIMGWLLQLC